MAAQRFNQIEDETTNDQDLTPFFGARTISDPFQNAGDGYTYPEDGPESDRLVWHHESMRLCLNGLYPCPKLVQKVLAPCPGVTKRVIDLGCGSRIWAMQLAREFPHVAVMGWDRPNVQAIWSGDTPSNCRFEARTSWRFLRNYPDHFDLIHMRFVAGSCLFFLDVLDAVETALKPGGLFILIDTTGDIIDEGGIKILRMKSSSHPEGLRLRRLSYEVHHINCESGFDENMMLATLEDGLWEHTDLEDCKAAELLIPIGPWREPGGVNGSQPLKDAGRLMRQSLRALQPGHEELLLSLGFDKGIMHKWKDEIARELADDSRNMSLDVRILWGRRPLEKEDEGVTTPRQPAMTPVDDDWDAWDETPSDAGQYRVPEGPHYHVYDSQRKWKRMLDARRIKGGGMPERVEPFIQRRSRQSPVSPRSVHSHRSSASSRASTSSVRFAI